MLSILARTFMVATQTQTGSGTRKREWLPEDHWWKESKRTSYLSESKGPLDRVGSDQ
ncbi:hypothetical protein [Ruegeria meonggei]|uniref:hypothetical protein n=1 Tax=Ruegeria meonggei TaxID=1446476 RepID=UPI00366EEC14